MHPEPKQNKKGHMDKITLNLSDEQTLELAKSVAFMDGYQAGVADTLARLKRYQVDLLLARQKPSPVQFVQKEKAENVAPNDAPTRTTATTTEPAEPAEPTPRAVSGDGSA
jgi:hypothetical protein